MGASDEVSSSRAKVIKTLLEQLREGAKASDVRAKLKAQLGSLSPPEIPLIEQELVKEGVSPVEISRMCELHVELFRDSLVSNPELRQMTPGHPLNTLLAENDRIAADAEKLGLFSRMLAQASSEEAIEALKSLSSELHALKRHFARLQLLVFPYIERRGITAVPRVLWTKQDELLLKMKDLNQALTGGESTSPDQTRMLRDKVAEVAEESTQMVFRENNILFPTLKTLLSEGEWRAIRENEEMIGYYKVDPGKEWKPSAKPVYPYQLEPGLTPQQVERLPPDVKAMAGEAEGHRLVRDGDLELEDGYLSQGEISAILRTLPFDMSFVDSDERVRFYNRTGGRTFPRAKTVLGRQVQLCHPPRSIAIVNKIVADFKAGKETPAEFWLNVGDKRVSIRYFPVRDGQGNFLGTLEVVQDIAGLTRLQGERSLQSYR